METIVTDSSDINVINLLENITCCSRLHHCMYVGCSGLVEKLYEQE